VQKHGGDRAAARRIVLRPLVTYDKVETTALARRIDTFETSNPPFSTIAARCSCPRTRHPRPRPGSREAEAKLDMAAEVAAATQAALRVPIAGSTVAILNDRHAHRPVTITVCSAAAVTASAEPDRQAPAAAGRSSRGMNRPWFVSQAA